MNAAIFFIFNSDKQKNNDMLPLGVIIQLSALTFI